MKFRVWCPDHDVTIDDASIIEAHDKHAAVDSFAQIQFCEDSFNDIVVRVVGDDGVIWEFEIDVVAEPTFEVMSVKKVTP